MIWIIISILISVISFICFVVDEGLDCAEDAFFMIGFSIIFGAVFFAVSLIPQNIITINNISNNTSVEDYEITEEMNLSTIKINGDHYFGYTSLGERKFLKDETFIIPWDKDNKYVYVVEQYDQSFVTVMNNTKVFIYVPRNEYRELSYSLNFTNDKMIPTTYIHPDMNFDIGELITTEDNSTITDTKQHVDYNTQTTAIKSIKIFKYELVDNKYIIRCEDGNILNLSKEVVRLKDSNDDLMYIDTIVTNVETTDGNIVEIYLYDLYK